MVELSGLSEPKITPEPATLEKVQAALRVPVGAASPLWFMFAGAATAGMAYWWMTRWAQPQNLEAMLGAAPILETLAEPLPLAIAELAPEGRSFAQEPEALEPEPQVEAAPEPTVVPPQEPKPEVAAAPEPEVEAPPLTGAALVAEVARLTGLAPTETMPGFDEPLDAPKATARKSAPKKAPPES